MAKVDAATFKAQVATAASALTTALGDDTLAELAVEFKNNHHPLRIIENLFRINMKNGVITANDSYIDSAYAGDFVAQAGRNSKLDRNAPPTPIAVVSATVEALAPADIVITFDRPVFENPITVVTLGGDSDPAKVVQSITYAGTVVTITVDTDYVALATITVSGRFFGNRGYIDLADEVVINNVV